ncbi:hypothetical protein ACA910_000116 [Epithemia clementina (nom. ined.)]
MDKYSCHYQGSVANQIEDLGVEWDIIPGGCTGLVQPIDVGIGKPWKYRVWNHVENWMLETNNDRVSPKDTQQLIAIAACKAWENLPEEVVYNAWRRDTFGYFPNEATKPTAFVEEEYYSSDEESENGGDDEVAAVPV